MDSVVLQCSSVRKNQDNLGILQKDHSQNVMYWTLLIELLSLKHTFDRINCFGGYITRGVICNCHIKRNGSLTFLAMLGSPPCLRRRSTMEE